MSVVITRSQEGNVELARRLRLAGLDPITVDTISLAPPEDWEEVDLALRKLDSFDWVIFTSSAGARYFGRRMKELSLRLPADGKPRVAAVGRQTAAAISSLGLGVHFVPSRFTTATLGEELPSDGGLRVLLLRSDAANPQLEGKLLERGFAVEKAAIYRTISLREHSRRLMDADILLFASPSAVESFCSIATGEELQRLKKLPAVCIGPVTESAAKERGFAQTRVPRSYTIEAAVDEVSRLTRE